MASSNRAPLAACRSALIQRFRQIAPQTMLNEKGYVSEVSQNLIEGVRLGDFEADLRQGDGNELESKFRAVHSSSALAVNTFAPFKSDPATLKLPVSYRFDTPLHFERKCPHGLAGRCSPNLDVVVEGPSGVLAIESKCLESLTPHKAEFAPAYSDEIKNGRRRTAWFEEMLRLTPTPCTYRWLDAAQLVKHALGLAYTFVERPTTLLYLFWEPSNPEAYPRFAEHRAELAQFASAIRGSRPEFVSLSYPQLWQYWDTCPEPGWLAAHVGRLRARYEVTV